MKFLVAFLLVTLVIADLIPEAKLSLSLSSLGDLKQDVLQPMIEKIAHDRDIPVDLNFEKHIPILGNLKFSVSHAHLNTLALDWTETVLQPYLKTENTLFIQISKLSVDLSADLTVSLGKFSLINSKTDVTLTDVSMSMVIRLDATTDETSWGFVPIIIDSAVDMSNLKISFETSKIPEFIVNLIVKAVEPFLPNILNSAIKNTIGSKIEEIATASALQFTFKVPNTDSTYELLLKATEPPKILYNKANPYLNVAVNLDITNTKTGEKCPSFNEGTIPDRVYQGLEDIEIMVADNLMDQILWTLLNSGIVDLSVNDKQLQKLALPLSLTTTGMRLLVPQFEQKYGENKGMYLHITKGIDPVPQLFLRSGRLLGFLELNIEFIVDTDSSLYPQKLSDCKTCVSAHVCNGKLGLMVTLFNNYIDKDTYIAANIMQIKIQDLTYVSGEVTLDDEILKNTLNVLVSALVPQLNIQARAGIKNPLIGMEGIKDFDLLMGDTYILASIEFQHTESGQ